MGKHAVRAPVYVLTPNEEAAISLWLENKSGLSVYGFSKALGVSYNWMLIALDKQRLRECVEPELLHYGVSSLARARGVKRLKGTK